MARHPGGGPVLVHVDVHAAADDHVHLDIRYLLVGPGRRRADTTPGGEPGRGLVHLGGGRRVADDALAGALRSARRLSATGPPPGPGGTPEESDG